MTVDTAHLSNYFLLLALYKHIYTEINYIKVFLSTETGLFKKYIKTKYFHRT